MPASAKAGAASVRKAHASAASRSTALGPRFAQAALDGREESRGGGEGAEQMLLCGVEAMPEAAAALAPSRAAPRSAGTSRLGSSAACRKKRSGKRLRLSRPSRPDRRRVGKVQPEAGARRLRLRAERGAGPRVEIADERALLEPFRREAGIGPAERDDEPPLPGDVRGLLPATVAQADRGAHERIGGRVQERPQSASGAQTLERLRTAAAAVRRHGVSGERERLRQLRRPAPRPPARRARRRSALRCRHPSRARLAARSARVRPDRARASRRDSRRRSTPAPARLPLRSATRVGAALRAAAR